MFAQTTEERLDRLERLLERVLERLEDQDARLDALSTQEQEIIEEVQEVVQSERALQLTTQQEMEELRILLDEYTAGDLPGEGIGFKVGATRFRFGGFIKSDLSFSRFSDGEPGSGSIARDFFVPSQIPVNPVSLGGVESTDDEELLDFDVRETRFNFRTETPLGDSMVRGFLEVDFAVLPGNNEIITNRFPLNIRHALISYENWDFGQTWSTFFDVRSLPESLDFIGPTNGTLFVRQPLLRYTRGPFQFAIEQPETSIADPTGTSASNLINGDEIAPDFIARYNYTFANGFVSLAGIVRQLSFDGTPVAGQFVDDRSIAGGAALAGQLRLANGDDIKFQASGGLGIGRYLGLALFPDAAFDLATGQLDAVPVYAGYVAYRHFWSGKLRSTLTLAGSQAAFQDALANPLSTRSTYSVQGNLIYSPIPKWSLGSQIIFAEREIEAGDSGDLFRVQFTTRYDF
ncbi:MAG: DcaP family trimeric outer membrane transporter [Rhodothalassiaceae bacterium]